MTKFTNILAYINTHSESQPGLEKALQLAAANRARLTVVDVVGEFPRLPRSQEIHQVIIREKEEKLAELRQEVYQSGLEITTHLAAQRVGANAARR